MSSSRHCLLKSGPTAEATWQNTDYVMWQLMKDKKEWMRSAFACPEQVKEKLKLTSLVFSDQIPFWVKIAPKRQLYGESETRKPGRNGDKLPAPMSQKLEGHELVEKASEAGGGQTQKRGQGISEQDKYRVTFEVTQVVDN